MKHINTCVIFTRNNHFLKLHEVQAKVDTRQRKVERICRVQLLRHTVVSLLPYNLLMFVLAFVLSKSNLLLYKLLLYVLFCYSFDNTEHCWKITHFSNHIKYSMVTFFLLLVSNTF